MSELKDLGKKHYHLAALEVIYKKNERSIRHPMNALVLTDDGLVTRETIAQIQHNAQVRFISEINQTSKISDIFITGIMNLGYMTQKEFHGSFAEDLDTKTDGNDAAGSPSSGGIPNE